MNMLRSNARLTVIRTALLLAVLVVGMASTAQAQRTSSRAARLVTTTSAHVLVTPKGRTLYVFAADAQNKSNCAGECAKFWPPRLVSATAHPRAHVPGVPGTFGVITRADGTRQLTYDGAPLYTFAGDKKAGDMNGQGVFASGGYWWVVVAAGK